MSGLSKTATRSIATFRPDAITSRPRASAGISTRTKSVDLGSGQQLYVKIVSLESWGVSVSGSKNFERDTFYAWLIPQEVAQVEIARNRSGI
jgi:hypothetical protein